MGFKKISDTSAQPLENVLMATDVDTVKACKELSYSKLFLLPKDCWLLREIVMDSRARHSKTR